MNEDNFYATMNDEQRDSIGYVKGKDIDNDIDYELRCEIEHSLYDISMQKEEINEIDILHDINMNENSLNSQIENDMSITHKTSVIYSKLKLCNIIIIFVVITSLILSSINYYINFTMICSTKTKTNIWDRLYSNDDNSIFYLLSTLMNSVLTIVLITNIYIKTSLITSLNITTKHLSKSETLLSSNDYLTIIFEIFLSLPHPMLSIADRCLDMNITIENEINTVRYEINEIVFSFQFIRLYFLFNSILYLSTFASPSSFHLTSLLSIRNDAAFVIKCVYQRHPFVFVLVVYLLNISITGVIIYIAERPITDITRNVNLLVNKDNSIISFLFAVFTSSVTIGYGDIIAYSLIGKIASIISIMIGIVCIALLIVTISKSLLIDSTEMHILTLLSRLQMTEEYDAINNKVMTTALYIAVKRCKYESIVKAINALGNKKNDRSSLATTMTTMVRSGIETKSMMIKELRKIEAQIAESKLLLCDSIKKRKFIELKLKSQSKNFAVEEGIINSVNDVLYRVKNYKEEISQCINSYEVNIKRERKVINSIENKIYS